jgi:hypothetical protein
MGGAGTEWGAGAVRANIRLTTAQVLHQDIQTVEGGRVGRGLALRACVGRFMGANFCIYSTTEISDGQISVRPTKHAI